MADDEEMQTVEQNGHDSDVPGEGVMSDDAHNDSSDEEEDDPEEARRIAEGFIVDDNAPRKHKKKRRKHRERDAAQEDLEEDDLDLLQENTGIRIARPNAGPRLVRRRSDSADIDRDDDLQPRGELARMFDDDEDAQMVDAGVRGHVAAAALGDYDDEDDMRDFIEEEPEEEQARLEREAREKERADRRGQRKSGPIFVGLPKEAWNDVKEIFGTGNEYDWALGPEEDVQTEKATIHTVYEPAEIEERMLSSTDDAIREIDIPERIQITHAPIFAARGINDSRIAVPLISVPDEREYVPENETAEERETRVEQSKQRKQEQLDALVGVAAEWIAPQISPLITQMFLLDQADGSVSPLRSRFMTALHKVVAWMLINYYSVPYLWIHRHDFLVSYDADNPDPTLRSVPLMQQSDLYRIETLAYQYIALVDRKAALQSFWEKLDVPQQEDDDQYYDYVLAKVNTVEEVDDLEAWVHMRHSRRVRELKQFEEDETRRRQEEEDEQKRLQLEQDGMQVDVKTDRERVQKRAVAESRYERLRRTPISALADSLAIPAWHLARDLDVQHKTHFFEDPTGNPLQHADTYANPGTLISTAEEALTAARQLVVHELATDPLIRRLVRQKVMAEGVVSCRPTDKGLTKITNLHPASPYKYLDNKPISRFGRSNQFLYILETEAEGDITVTIGFEKLTRAKLLQDMTKMYLSDYEGTDARAWNELRVSLLTTALDEHLLPIAARSAREKMREEAADFVASRCAEQLEAKVETMPYCNVARQMQAGDRARIVAVSHGSGDPKRDSVHAVYLNERGEQRAFISVENLRQSNERTNPRGDEFRAKFVDFLVQHEPHVIVIGGFTVNTHQLAADVRTAAKQAGDKLREKVDYKPYYRAPQGEEIGDQEVTEVIEVIYVDDSAARIYQHSKRAQVEFPGHSSTFKYCVSLARYAQGPIDEFCALGRDLTSVSFDPAQKFVDASRLQLHLERVLEATVTLVGVDINHAIVNSYHALMLPYVAGLGPRKADALIKTLRRSREGSLIYRNQLVTRSSVQENVYYNVAAFLRIEQPNRESKDADDFNTLDCTRIHPENYDMAVKMASDALELDEEDLAGMAHPSEVIRQLIDEGQPQKLDELSLDDFAAQLEAIQGVPKRLTLYFIRDELKSPFRERRPEFRPPSDLQVFTQLTGETDKTIQEGFIVPAVVTRFWKSNMSVKLDCGVEGDVSREYADGEEPREMYQQGQTIQAVVLSVDHKNFKAELDARTSEVAKGDVVYRAIRPDNYNNNEQAEEDFQRVSAKRSKGAQKSQRRLIPHSHFHPLNAGQAEAYLASMPRGECVIRPSSRGNDHLAITWKVEDGVYQHIDVLELDKPSEFQLGRTLKIGKYTYSDLDEVIVSHVRAMVRKVDEMTVHAKYHGSEESLNTFLRNFQMANPDKSIYGFGLDRKRPGQFMLTFIAQKGQPPKTWPVRIEPGAFLLFDGQYPDVTSLCNGFKTQYATRAMSGPARPVQQAPYGGGRTPAYISGGLTPYGGATGRAVQAPAGWATPRQV